MTTAHAPTHPHQFATGAAVSPNRQRFVRATVTTIEIAIGIASLAAVIASNDDALTGRNVQ